MFSSSNTKNSSSKQLTILIYTQPSNRVEYTFRLVFEELLGAKVQFTYDISSFKNSHLPKFIYTNEAVSEEVWFWASDFLYQTEIKKQDISIEQWNEFPVFFYKKNNSLLDFDPFAMIFYLVSRYEEYLSDQRDQHDRFPAHESIAYQNKFLDRPLVDELAILIKNRLSVHYPTLVFPTQTFQFTPTYDIDYAWSYLYKGWKRSIGGVVRDLVKYPKNIIQRLQVQLGKTDPYFTFDYLDQLHQTFKLQPIYFFLVGNYGDFDKNISIQKKPFQQLIKRISQQYTTGIHPSYQSNTAYSILEKEYNNFNRVIQFSTTKSRQHFLKLSFPNTYRNLLQLGIQEDYTMGYAEELGFRASIAKPFFWFDLEKNEATTLKIYPFQLMDVTLKNYLQLSTDEAIIKTKEIIQRTQTVNGHFISLWHNNSFCEQEGWESWRNVFEEQLRYIDDYSPPK